MNIAALFGAESPEAMAGCFAIAEFLAIFREVHTKKR